MTRCAACVLGVSMVFTGSLAAATETAPTLVSGIDRTGIDPSVRPQDDFFLYVNGGWLKTAEIPPDRTATGTMYDLREKAREDVLKIIQDVAAKKDLAPGSDEQKVADMYNSFMDVATVDKVGLEPLQGELAAIAAIEDKAGVVAHFARHAAIGVGSPFTPYVNTDGKDSSRYAAHLYQGGLGLPDRDYYFTDDERSKALRAAYVAHIEKMFALAGLPEPAAAATMLMALETRIAGAHWTKVECRDRDKTYNKVATADLGQLAGTVAWPVYLEGLGIAGEKDLIVNQPTYVTAFDTVFADTSVADWKTYLTWNLLNSYADYLRSDLDQENFEFYARTMQGQSEQKPRWKRGVDVVNGSLGEVIGKVYVSRHFTPEAKARMVQLVGNLQAAYGDAIAKLAWMSPTTKAEAKKKLERFVAKVGYPDRWEDYSKLQVKPTDLVGNVMRANRFQFELERSKLGGPIRRYEWGMTPQTVNAYYNPGMNEIVFPAAILQPPFFNLAADDAVNYGAIGAVIGHEMGHGFDDQGSKYNADGNMQNWWTEQDLAEFHQRTAILVDQFAAFKVFDDLKVNGELTLGENIGDLTGLTISYRAYQRSLGGAEAPVIDGMTGPQRFFIGIGQVWRYKDTEETARNRVATDPHSPPRFRVFGPLRNMPEFHAAFGVKEGDGMYLPPEQRVKLW